ncbi:MFS transporter, partial [Streptomyces sp. NPDC048279]|uniref:MFS transporter n=1 Tax=Streptomyces sp. NPDC048279 TaxID=3154714 RepID=UPI00342C9E83
MPQLHERQSSVTIGRGQFMRLADAERRPGEFPVIGRMIYGAASDRLTPFRSAGGARGPGDRDQLSRSGDMAVSTKPGPGGGSSGSESSWAPLALPVFRALWIAQFVSNVGTWMQTVGAQWLLLGHGATLVTLVQTASSLPVVLLALPSGVLADRFDRRRLLVVAQLA